MKMTQRLPGVRLTLTEEQTVFLVSGSDKYNRLKLFFLLVDATRPGCPYDSGTADVYYEKLSLLTSYPPGVIARLLGLMEKLNILISAKIPYGRTIQILVVEAWIIGGKEYRNPCYRPARGLPPAAVEGSGGQDTGGRNPRNPEAAETHAPDAGNGGDGHRNVVPEGYNTAPAPEAADGGAEQRDSVPAPAGDSVPEAENPAPEDSPAGDNHESRKSRRTLGQRIAALFRPGRKKAAETGKGGAE